MADTIRSQLTQELGRAIEEMGFTYAAEGRGRQYGASIVTAVLMEADNESLRKIIANLRAQTERVQTQLQQ
jgi:N-acyl-L-homoserine lactone synthetase